jgi:hypothetical protein
MPHVDGVEAFRELRKIKKDKVKKSIERRAKMKKRISSLDNFINETKKISEGEISLDKYEIIWRRQAKNLVELIIKQYEDWYNAL